MTEGRARVETVALIGGLAVLDLVNTVSWRGSPARSEDHLSGADQALHWALRTATITADEADRLRGCILELPAAAAFVDGIRTLRDMVAVAVTTDDVALAPDLEAVIVDAIAHAHLVPSPTQRRWRVSTLDQHTVRRRLALQCEELLRTGTHRIGICADVECQWVFLDTSRAQNRRWCSSADCGNRTRVRRHAHRHRRSSGG